MVNILITINSRELPVFPCISPYFPVFPRISPYLPVSPRISPYFPVFPRISPYFPIFHRISRLFNNAAPLRASVCVLLRRDQDGGERGVVECGDVAGAPPRAVRGAGRRARRVHQLPATQRAAEGRPDSAGGELQQPDDQHGGGARHVQVSQHTRSHARTRSAQLSPSYYQFLVLRCSYFCIMSASRRFQFTGYYCFTLQLFLCYICILQFTSFNFLRESFFFVPLKIAERNVKIAFSFSIIVTLCLFFCVDSYFLYYVQLKIVERNMSK